MLCRIASCLLALGTVSGLAVAGLCVPLAYAGDWEPFEVSVGTAAAVRRLAGPQPRQPQPAARVRGEVGSVKALRPRRADGVNGLDSAIPLSASRGLTLSPATRSVALVGAGLPSLTRAQHQHGIPFACPRHDAVARAGPIPHHHDGIGERHEGLGVLLLAVAAVAHVVGRDGDQLQAAGAGVGLWPGQAPRDRRR